MTDVTHIEARAFHRYGKIVKVVRKSTKQPHGKLVDACVKWLFAHGVFCWVNRTGSLPVPAYQRKDGTWSENRRLPYGKKGSGDIIGCTRNGKHIEVEAKVDRDEQRHEQSDHEQRIKEKRGLYYVIYDVEELEQHKAEILG